jgi:hypothetical protein
VKAACVVFAAAFKIEYKNAPPPHPTRANAAGGGGRGFSLTHFFCTNTAISPSLSQCIAKKINCRIVKRIDPLFSGPSPPHLPRDGALWGGPLPSLFLASLPSLQPLQNEFHRHSLSSPLPTHTHTSCCSVCDVLLGIAPANKGQNFVRILK